MIAKARVAGFDELEDQWGKPPVALTFWMYRVMIGIGVMLAGDVSAGVLVLVAREAV